MRVFLAIPINSEEIILDMPKLPKYMKKINKTKWHITLNFFGSKNKLEVREIIRKINKVNLSTIKLFNPKLNFFSDAVFVINFDYSGNLYKNIKEAFNLDNNFKPHITIARIKGRLDVRDKERLLKGRVESDVNIEDFILYKSNLTPKGPKYEILNKWKLNNNLS